MKKRTLTMLWVSVVFLIASYTHAQKGLQPVDLQKIKNVAQVTVSPDGSKAAYLLVTPRPIKKGSGSAYTPLYVYDKETDEHHAITDKDANVSSLGWTPDGKYITYRKSTSEENGSQVFAVKPDGSEKQQITNFNRSVRAYEYRNAQNLVFTAAAPKNSRKEKLKEKGFKINVVEEDPRDIELWRMNLESGEKTKLTDEGAVFDFTVSPDGKKIAAAIAPENTTDASYMFKRIHILDAETGDLLEKIENPGKLSSMAWSPDSKRLAFQAAAIEADAVAGSLFVFETGQDVDYEDIENIVEDMPLSVIDIAWKDKNTLLFASEESVDITLRSYNPINGKIKTLLEGGKVIFSGFSNEGNSIFLAGNTAEHPSELMHYDLKSKKLNKLSKHNEWLKNRDLARQEKISYTAEDGTRIDGVLIYPLDYNADETYPLITYIHGGPEAAVQNGWLSRYSTWGQFAAASNFFVFYPNYRASSGRGVDYTMEGFGDLLGKEYSDVLDGIDYLIDEGKVDPNLVGIGGGSYGGYFAAWSSTKHTDRFAASVVFVGVTNQVSKRNITDIPWEDYLVHWGFWTHEDHEAVWEASPVKYAHQSKTPTLILHGEEDPRVPITQGEELYRSLKLHGEAPVRFVTYPGEGHGNRKNTNRYDYLVRTLEWFDFYLNENPDSKQMPSKYPEYKLTE